MFYSGSVPKQNAITATRSVTLPVTVEADAVLDLAPTREEVTVVMTEIVTVAHQDLALMREETDTAETIEIEEVETITEIGTTTEKTDVILVALDLTSVMETAEEEEIDMEEEVETVRIEKENRDLLSNADLRSARENSAELAEAAVLIAVREEEDLPLPVATREKRDNKVSF